MNALQKVAWTEVIVTFVASAAALAAIPLLRERSIWLFGLLAVAPAIYPLWVRQRGNVIVRDERDDDIARRSESCGVSSAWMFFVISMIAISMWYHPHAIPTGYVFTLIWIQFAIYIGVKGMAALLFYRGVNRAA